MELTTYATKPKTLITEVLLTTVFFLLFLVIYNPLFGHRYATEDYATYKTMQGLVIPIASAILLVVMALSRTAMYFVSRFRAISMWSYFFWLVVEVLITALFIDLFISLLFHEGYFEHLNEVLFGVVMVVIYPYAFFWVLQLYHVSETNNRLYEEQIAELQQGLNRNDPGAIRFADEKGNVKLVVQAQYIYYIESAGNYVTIHYENRGKLTRFALRNTLKGIEQVCIANDLVRCHRSYFINLHKIKLLRKEGENIFAEMDNDDIDDIPVSKTYAGDVMAKAAQT